MRSGILLSRPTVFTTILLASVALRAFAQAAPERVSDDIAYRQFIIAASERSDARDATRERRDAFIRRIGLSPKDEASLMAALRTVRERLDEVAQQRQALGATASPAALAALEQREDAVFEGADRRVRAFLSKGGWQLLDQFVREQVAPNPNVYSNTSH
jgi:hypothetical protein